MPKYPRLPVIECVGYVEDFAAERENRDDE
jgi:hypothetical protein